MNKTYIFKEAAEKPETAFILLWRGTSKVSVAPD